MDQLNERQRRFVEAYLEDPSATRAAIKAGYSPKTASAIGSENLRKPAILAEIEKERRQRRERNRLKADDVIHELEKQAMFDPRELFVSEEDFARELARKVADLVSGGMKPEQATKEAIYDVRRPGSLKDMSELTLDQALAVAERWQTADGPRVKVYSRQHALELLAKHHGLLEQRIAMRVEGPIDTSKLTTEQLMQFEELLDAASHDSDAR